MYPENRIKVKLLTMAIYQLMVDIYKFAKQILALLF
jgi:hypothetical protein